jgi:predicted permease
MFDASDEPARGRTAVISHGLWQRRFGGDPGIVGKDVLLNLVPFTVLGVTPPGFTFPPQSPVDVFVPQSPQGIASDTHRDARGMQVSALLRPGATWKEARAEMDQVAARLALQYPENRGFGVAVEPIRESVAGDVRAPLLALLGALGLVVVLVCVNVANLQLAKLDARGRDFAVRAALGASRGRLLRQAVAESLLLAVAASALGFALAPLGIRALLGFVPTDQVPWLRVETDRTVLLGLVLLVGIVTVLAGLLPALRGTRVDLRAVLHRGGRGFAGASGRRLRHASVVAQIALSLALVAGAALLVRSFLRLQGVDPGFRAEGRMTMSYMAPRARYGDGARLAALAGRVRDEVAQANGVTAAGVAQTLPFTPGVVWLQALTRDDPRGISSLAELPHVHYNVVSPGYAEALGVPVVAGRGFDAHDTAEGAPVVVVNQAAATRFFPGEDPIGQRLWVGHAQALPNLPARTVVGVVGDARWSGLDEPAGPEAWVPFAQQSGGEDVFRTMFVVYAAEGDATAPLSGVRARIRGVDPDLAVTSVRTLVGRLDESLWRHRLAASAVGALGLAAAAIALLGVFGVTAYLVGRREQEMGVRLAVGACPRDVLSLVMGESGRLVLAGMALGSAGAFAIARLMSGLLFGVGAADAVPVLAAALGLAACALFACYLPARRAARVDPLVALRAD